MKQISIIIFENLLICVVCILVTAPASIAALNQKPTYHASTEAQPRETPPDLLNRCGLDTRHTRAFLLLNELPSDRNTLQPTMKYRIPAYVHDYDGVSISTSLGIPMTEAIRLREINAEFVGAGVKPPIVDDQEIWVPYYHVLEQDLNFWSLAKCPPGEEQ